MKAFSSGGKFKIFNSHGSVRSRFQLFDPREIRSVRGDLISRPKESFCKSHENEIAKKTTQANDNTIDLIKNRKWET